MFTTWIQDILPIELSFSIKNTEEMTALWMHTDKYESSQQMLKKKKRYEALTHLQA